MVIDNGFADLSLADLVMSVPDVDGAMSALRRALGKPR